MNQSNQTTINFAPNGMISTKAMALHVSLSVNEIIEEVQQAFEIGITMAYLHVRDEKTGEPVYYSEIYGLIFENLRKLAPFNRI